jgi:hypothetical protein
MHAAYAPAAAMAEMDKLAGEIKEGLTEQTRKATHSRAYTQKRGRS